MLALFLERGSQVFSQRALPRGTMSRLIDRVAPDQVALHEAEHFMGVNVNRVRMLSLGTGTLGYQPSEGVSDDASGSAGCRTAACC